ncbi:MAG: hypothetical protein HOV79_21325 [Hamadaea sp.]|nr:hypothetical protein [Hamadaea sp.]
MAYTRGRHRTGRPGLVHYRVPAGPRVRRTPAHRRDHGAPVAAPVTLAVTLLASLILLLAGGYATAEGAVAIAAIFIP